MGVSCQHEQHTGRRKNGIPAVPDSKNVQHKLLSHGARGGRSCAERASDHIWGYGGVAKRNSSSKAAPHDEQELSEALPGTRVSKVNSLKSLS